MLSCYINLEDIFVYDGDIIVLRKGFLEYRNKVFINLYRHHFSCSFGQILCQGTDSRSDLKHHVILGHACGGNNLVQHMRIDQEILTEFLLKTKVVLFDQLYCVLRISEIRHLSFLFV